MEDFRVFIVHGHNHQKLSEVKQFIKAELNLDTVVLNDERSGGMTLLEKFEHYANSVKYAIIILSDDDYGMSRGDSEIDFVSNMTNHIRYLHELMQVNEHYYDASIIPLPSKFSPFSEMYENFANILSNVKYRGRQNVILEMGYFFGKLGRKNMAILYSPGVELPSDINGLTYILYDDEGLWKVALSKEIFSTIS
jgi:predicted nucleotide-binding protein